MTMLPQTRKLSGRRCQCGGCGQYFAGITGFEKHRTGAYGSDRRCMTVAEMAEAGLVETVAGWWTVPMSEKAIARFKGLSDEAR